MTLFDLLFLVCALATIVVVIRVLYLMLRGRTSDATRTAKRWAIGAGIYLVALLATSIAQPGRTVAIGTPSCFDDFCIAIDSSSRAPTIGPHKARGSFVIVSGRVISMMAGRRQRETDVRGVLRDDAGTRHEVSAAGQEALRATGRAGSSLTDYVAPSGTNRFAVAYDVPAASRSMDFIIAHGWFPGALIIGGEQSLLHRPAVVRLP